MLLIMIDTNFQLTVLSLNNQYFMHERHSRWLLPVYVHLRAVTYMLANVLPPFTKGSSQFSSPKRFLAALWHGASHSYYCIQNSSPRHILQ